MKCAAMITGLQKPALVLGLVAMTALGAARLATARTDRDVPQYRVQLLGEVNAVKALNRHGHAVGWTISGGDSRAWVAKGNGIELLPPRPGDTWSRANDINDDGVIVGSTGSSNAASAAAWYPTANGYDLVPFGALPGHNWSEATAVNNIGDVIGFSVVPGWPGGPAVWFNSPQGVLNLGDLGFAATPTAINGQRQIVGGQLRMDLDTMVVENLGIPQGSYLWTVSNAVNASGQTAGYAQVATSSANNKKVARYSDGSGWEVLSNASPFSIAYGINDHGNVTCELPNTVAVYLNGLGMFAVDTLIHPDDQDWVTFTTFDNDINNVGQIVAMGHNAATGEAGAILLTPDTIAPPALQLTGPAPGTAGAINTFVAPGATPNEKVLFIAGRTSGSTPVPGCPGLDVAIAAPRLLGLDRADATGLATLDAFIPTRATGITVLFQAIDRASCSVSNVITHTF